MSRSITSASYHLLNWAVWLFDELCCLGQLFIVPISYRILHGKLFKDQGFMCKLLSDNGCFEWKSYMLWISIAFANGNKLIDYDKLYKYRFLKILLGKLLSILHIFWWNACTCTYLETFVFAIIRDNTPTNNTLYSPCKVRALA